MSARPLQPCGSKAAYERHRRLGEEACEACRAANTEASQRWRKSASGRRSAQAPNKALAGRRRVARKQGVVLDPDGTWPTRVCPFCQCGFKPSHGSQKYCGEDCRRWAHLLRHGAKWLVAMSMSERKAMAAARRATPRA